jgi:hypothetical protein
MLFETDYLNGLANRIGIGPVNSIHVTEVSHREVTAQALINSDELARGNHSALTTWYSTGRAFFNSCDQLLLHKITIS